MIHNGRWSGRRFGATVGLEWAPGDGCSLILWSRFIRLRRGSGETGGAPVGTPHLNPLPPGQRQAASRGLGSPQRVEADREAYDETGFMENVASGGPANRIRGYKEGHGIQKSVLRPRHDMVASRRLDFAKRTQIFRVENACGMG